MLYENFANTEYCTTTFLPGQTGYHAAMELAADLARALLIAYDKAVAARERSDAQPENPGKNFYAEQCWEEFGGLQSLACENPNLPTFLSKLKQSYLLQAQDPAA